MMVPQVLAALKLESEKNAKKQVTLQCISTTLKQYLDRHWQSTEHVVYGTTSSAVPRKIPTLLRNLPPKYC